jgi:predicted RND superfamily exporter protein
MSVTRRTFEVMLRRRWMSLGALLLLCLGAVLFARTLRTDFSVESYFPVGDQARTSYDRYKRDFPTEDTAAVVVVESSTLWSNEGLARVAALEDELARIQGVLYTEGLSTVRDVTRVGTDEIRMEPLFPKGPLSEAEIARRREIATHDPLFSWRLAPPPPPTGPELSATGPAAGATTIRVILDPQYAGKEETRNQFYVSARDTLKRHEVSAVPGQPADKISLSGVPVIRSQYVELINLDNVRLFPVALVLILGLLYLGFRSLGGVGVTFLTIAGSVLWTYGFMGVVGYPVQVMTAITPIVVMIISISDTVHILSHYQDELGHGKSRRDALVEAMTATALPCLLTEITIACGFLTLLSVNLQGIQQFGLTTAVGVLFAWLANMAVLPLAIDWIEPHLRPQERTPVTRALERVVSRIEALVIHHPRRIWVVTGVLLTGSLLLGSQIHRDYTAWDDLRPEGDMKRTIRYAERIHGGLVPLAIYLEPKPGPDGAVEDPMFDPAAIALMDRVTQFLKTHFPEIRSVHSAADPWRKTFQLFAPDVAAASGGLPTSKAMAAQLFTMFDERRLTRDFLTPDRRTAAVVAMLPEMPSARTAQILKELDAYLSQESKATGYPLTPTALFVLLDDINNMLVNGLITSFGSAILVSLVVFCLVLRSIKLGLVGLLPNVLPLGLTLAFMRLANIALKPSTVIVFAITLTIADDDTIQYLARFREVFFKFRKEGSQDPHHAAAVETLRETGLPMFLTAASVSMGFLCLAFSQFLGTAHLGVLVGVSLFTAVFGDLFLSPALLIHLRPELRSGWGFRRKEPAADAVKLE